MTRHWNATELLGPLMDALGAASIVVSASGQVLAMSDGARRRVGRSDARPIIDIASVFEDEPDLRQLLADAADGSDTGTASLRSRAAGGEPVRVLARRLLPATREAPALVLLTMQGLARPDGAGLRPGSTEGAATADLVPGPAGPAAASRDDTAPRLKALTLKDRLTGLENRRSFSERLHREWRVAGERKADITLVTADIDRLEAYNAALGRDDGDRVLRQVALAIADAASRAADSAFRLGGGGFAVLLPGTPLEGGHRVAQRIMTRLETLALPHPDNTPPRVSLSIGVASARPPGGETWRDLVRRADGALYLAKREGRNRIHQDASGGPGTASTAI